MNAQEIAAVVGTTPKPWWPHIIADGERLSWFCNHHGTYLTELLFTGSMVSWLAKMAYKRTDERLEGAHLVVTVEPHGSFAGTLGYSKAGHYVPTSMVPRSGPGMIRPTLFHALHAACVAAEESKKPDIFAGLTKGQA